MTTDPYLEIVVPAYNEEDNIEACLDSILYEETPRPYGVLVVDDGSSDRTPAILERYEREHEILRVKRHDPNRGYGATIQSGFESTIGEIVCFIDGDSVLKPGSLEVLMADFEAGADAVFGYVDVKNDHRLHGLYCKVGKRHNEDARYGGALMSFRTEVLDDLGGFLRVENRGGHDVEIKERVRRSDFDIVFEDEAKVYSRFPEGWRNVLQQKFLAGKTHVIHMHQHPEKFDPRVLLHSAYYGVILVVAVASAFFWPLSIVLAGLLVPFVYEHGPIAREMYDTSNSLTLGLLYFPYALAAGYLRTAGYLSERRKLVSLLRMRRATERDAQRL